VYGCVAALGAGLKAAERVRFPAGTPKEGALSGGKHQCLAAITDAGSRSARTHRGIESKPRRMPDAAFREGRAQNGKDRSAADMVLPQKITLNLIRMEPTGKHRK
jgi:hypothetical protein